MIKLLIRIPFRYNYPHLKKKIIYTGAFRFPDKDAAAARVLAIGKILRKIGYEVVFAGWEEEERAIDRQENGSYVYQGFEYYSMGELADNGGRSFLKKATEYIAKGQKTLEWIKKNGNGLHAIIVYNSNTFFLRSLRTYCENNQVSLIADVTEWYDGNQLPMGRFGIPAIANRWRMKVLNPQIKKLIVISSYLEKYYGKRGCNTINIPPLVDFEDKKWSAVNTTDNKELTLVYAGSPGRKDFLAPILEALSILKEKDKKVNLRIYGLDGPQTRSLLPATYDLVQERITCYGRIPQEEVPKQLAKADYSILLRADKRYAHAGFSTKLVESLSSGVPVISNGTGDIKSVIGADENGFLLTSPSAISLSEGLLSLLNENSEIHLQRRKNAKAYAEKVFNYEVYTDALEKYFSRLSSPNAP